MRKSLIYLMSLLAGTLIIIVSCSNKSTQPVVNSGNPSDPPLALAKNDANASVSEFASSAVEGSRWLRFNPGPFNMSFGDSVSYDSTSGWHVLTRSFTGPVRQFAVVDSFRFTALDGIFQFRGDSTTNIFELRLKKSSSVQPNSDLPGVQRSRSLEINTRWVGLADSVTTLNGDFHRHAEGSNQFAMGDSADTSHEGDSPAMHRDEDDAGHFFGDGENFFGEEGHFVQFTRDVQGQFQNVEFHTADLRSGERVRPFAGTLVEQISLDIVTPNNTITFSATVTITFSPGGFHADMSGDNKSLDWDELFENIGM